jgi:hypothetical protein
MLLIEQENSLDLEIIYVLAEDDSVAVPEAELRNLLLQRAMTIPEYPVPIVFGAIIEVAIDFQHRRPR